MQFDRLRIAKPWARPNKVVLDTFLELLDISSLRFFRPLHDLEPDSVPLFQHSISVSHNLGIEDEYIRPIFRTFPVQEVPYDRTKGGL